MCCQRNKFLDIRRNLPQLEIPCHRQKFLVTRRKFLSQEETSCHKKEFHAAVRNFLSQEEPLFIALLVNGWEDQNLFTKCWQCPRCPTMQLDSICFHQCSAGIYGYIIKEIQICKPHILFPNYRYFEHLLSRLTPAILGEIFS